MKYILIILLLLGQIVTVNARNKIRLFNLTNEPSIVVKAQIINITVSELQFDLGTIEGTCDLVIKEYCLLDSSIISNYSYLRLNDTLKNLKFAESENEKMVSNSYYLFIDLPDSMHLSDNAFILSFPYEMNRDTSLMGMYCSGSYQELATIHFEDTLNSKPASQKRKTKEFTYFSDGSKKTKSVIKLKKDGNIVRKFSLWDDKGNKITKQRKKGKKYDRGSRTIVWTFRENGKICFRRGVQILK